MLKSIVKILIGIDLIIPCALKILNITYDTGTTLIIGYIGIILLFSLSLDHKEQTETNPEERITVFEEKDIYEK